MNVTHNWNASQNTSPRQSSRGCAPVDLRAYQTHGRGPEQCPAGIREDEESISLGQGAHFSKFLWVFALEVHGGGGEVGDA